MTEEEIQKTVTDVLVTDFECDREKITLDTNLTRSTPSISSCDFSR